jgi:hypothetical protein
MDRPADPDPQLDPKLIKRLQRQLIAATFSRADFTMARSLCDQLLEHEWSSDDLTLWTALAVVYARPFLNSNDVGRLPARRFERFDDERQASIHQLLWTARHNTFAHTGVHRAHGVYVMPPGAWGEDDEGSATVGRVPFDPAVVPEIRQLCDLQAERADGWVGELVGRLYGYRTWPEGMMFPLDWPEADAATK